jgi:transcriptional regulator with GAF, ATPase, and Fis domain
LDSRELEWLRRVRDLSQMLGSEEDPTRIPPLILKASRDLTGAERAFLVRVEGPDSAGAYDLKVLATHGFRQDGLSGAEGQVSRTVVEKVLSGGGRAVLTSRPADAELIRASSIVGRGIRSLVCVPLRMRGAVIGVLYLDHRGQEALFRESDLPTLQTFATQVALSLELARDAFRLSSRPPEFLVGESPAVTALLEEVRRVAATPDVVLICGEPGTELGLAAREVHAQSGDLQKLFRSIPCGGGPREEAARILGSAGVPGPLASSRTVCLEEVDTLGVDVQRVLARALQTGSFTVPGSAATESLSARLIALTRVDLAQQVRDGGFRADLYYRLDVQRLVVPPLRQRSEDIPLLCAAILARQGSPELAISPEAILLLQRYAWPGNVLELEGELRRFRAKGVRTIHVDHLSPLIREGRGVRHDRADYSGRTLGELEEELVRNAMRDSGGVKARAARQLGVPRSTLYHLLERYGIA